MDWIDYREKLGIGFCDDRKYKYLKQKVFNVLNSAGYIGCLDLDEYFKFCDLTSMPVNTSYLQDYLYDDRLSQCLSIIERTTSLNEFLAYYVALMNSVKTQKDTLQYWNRDKFSKILSEKLSESHIPFDLIECDEEFFVFPKGAKELDDALITETLIWLEDYPNTNRAFIKALKLYSNADEDNASDVADLFRKALESFFQEFFGKTQSLENLKVEYGRYMKAQGVPSEISNNFETLLQSYTNFINGYAKHHDKTSKKVLEYIMYQTGNIIRFLITLKKEEN